MSHLIYDGLSGEGSVSREVKQLLWLLFRDALGDAGRGTER
jgi:hypothetical protein